jgi:hypothetical protein
LIVKKERWVLFGSGKRSFSASLKEKGGLT